MPELSWEEYVHNTQTAIAELAKQRERPGDYNRVQDENPFDGEACELMASSVSEQTKEVVMPLVIDQLYSCLKWTGRVAISVYTHEANGRGDLMLGVKAAQALRASFPVSHNTTNDIALLSAGSAVTKVPAVFQESNLPYVVLPGSKSSPGATAFGGDGAPGPEHLLIAPQLAVTKNVQVEARQKWKCTRFAMTEYSKQESWPYEPLPAVTMATGLGVNELGITFDAGLRAYKKTLEAYVKNPAAWRAARLSFLPKLLEGNSTHLLKALFPYSEKPLPGLVKAFVKNERSRLYYSYSNKSAARFALLVAALERNNEEDVHVLQVCPEFWNDKIAMTRSWFMGLLGPVNQEEEVGKTEARRQMNEFLMAMNVGQLEITEFPLKAPGDKTKCERTSITISGQSTKTLHLIFTAQGVSHDDLVTLIKASEPIIMMTGNQSTSEAFSAGKTIFYENIGFSQSVAFLMALYGGAGVPSGHIERIMAICRDFIKEGKKQNPPELVDFVKAADALLEIEQQRALAHFSDQASASKDLGRWLNGHYMRLMLLACPSLREGLLSREEALWKKFRSAGAYKEFVRELMSLGRFGVREREVALQVSERRSTCVICGQLGTQPLSCRGCGKQIGHVCNGYMCRPGLWAETTRRSVVPLMNLLCDACAKL